MQKIWNIYWKYVGTATAHRSELVSIQWLRGLAVLMVFVYHAEDILIGIGGWETTHTFWRSYGYSAPDLFFVISGFIMCFVTFELPFRPKDWLIRRFLRIYPIFWIFAFLSIGIYLVNPSLTMGSGQHDWGNLAEFLLLFPQEGIPLLFVTWTLEHEIVFYLLVFIIGALSGRALCVVVVTGILSLLGALRWIYSDSIPWLNFWDFHILSLYMIEFFMGALIFQLRHKLDKIGIVLPFVLTAILFLLAGQISESGIFGKENLPRILMFGSSFSFLLVGAINWEMKIRAKIQGFIEYKWRPFFVQIGDASYSVYLSHPFCLSICGKLIALSGLTGSIAFVALIIGAVLSLLFGWMVYHLLEKPMMHAFKAMLSRRKKAAAAQAKAG